MAHPPVAEEATFCIFGLKMKTLIKQTTNQRQVQLVYAISGLTRPHSSRQLSYKKGTKLIASIHFALQSPSVSLSSICFFFFLLLRRIEDGEDELVGAVLGGGTQARHNRRRLGGCGGRVGGVQPSEDAAEGDEPSPDPRQDARPGPHARRPRRSSPGAPLLRQQEQRSRSGLRLLLAAAVGDGRRRQGERAVELVN